jgi:hypothetical protein
MLPGLRFVFAAAALAVSVVIFGLGAAAFLRAAHENLASATAWRPIDEPLARRAEPAPPTLAMLRAEPERAASAPAAEPGNPEAVTTDATPETAPAAMPLPEATAIVPPQTEAAPVSAEREKQAAPVQAEAQPATSPAEAITVETTVPAADSPPPAMVAAPTSDDSAPATAASEPTATPGTAVARLVTEPKPENLQATSGPDATASTATQTPPAVEKTPAPPIAAQDGAETMPVAAASPGTDTLKLEDRQIKTAMATEPALPQVTPLPAREVRIPAPRIDPSVLEARRKQLILQQQARKARAAKARRVAAIRARAAAQARAAAVADPFGNPANTIPATR